MATILLKYVAVPVIGIAVVAGLLGALPLAAIFTPATTGDQISAVDRVSLVTARDLIPVAPVIIGGTKLGAWEQEMLRTIQANLTHASYGQENGGRFLFAAKVPLPSPKVDGTYAVVFQISKWVDKNPTQLGPILELDGPYTSIELLRNKYCLPYQVIPYVGYDPFYERPKPGEWRSPCQ